MFQGQFGPYLQAKIRTTQLVTTGKATLSPFTLFYSTLRPETENINIWKFKPLWFQKNQGLPASGSQSNMSILNLSEQALAESEWAILGKVLNFAASYPYSNLDMVCAVVTYSRLLLVSDQVFRWKIRSIISLKSLKQTKTLGFCRHLHSVMDECPEKEKFNTLLEVKALWTLDKKMPQLQLRDKCRNYFCK